MAYEQSLDRALVPEQKIEMGDDERLVIGLYSYNGAEPKYGEKREYLTRKGEWRTQSIGRKTAKEMQAIAPVMAQMSQLLGQAHQAWANAQAKKQVAAPTTPSTPSFTF